MPKQTRDAHLYVLAKRGAESRLRELLDELKLLTTTFPHLRDSFDPDELPVPFIIARGAAKLTRKQAGARKPSGGRPRLERRLRKK